MHIRRRSGATWQQMWWRFQGKQPLFTTYWIVDYLPGTTHIVDGRHYRITHVVRGNDSRHSIIWGQAVHAPTTVTTVQPARVEMTSWPV